MDWGFVPHRDLVDNVGEIGGDLPRRVRSFKLYGTGGGRSASRSSG